MNDDRQPVHYGPNCNVGVGFRMPKRGPDPTQERRGYRIKIRRQRSEADRDVGDYLRVGLRILNPWKAVDNSAGRRSLQGSRRLKEKVLRRLEENPAHNKSLSSKEEKSDIFLDSKGERFSAETVAFFEAKRREKPSRELSPSLVQKLSGHKNALRHRRLQAVFEAEEFEEPVDELLPEYFTDDYHNRRQKHQVYQGHLGRPGSEHFVRRTAENPRGNPLLGTIQKKLVSLDDKMRELRQLGALDEHVSRQLQEEDLDNEKSTLRRAEANLYAERRRLGELVTPEMGSLDREPNQFSEKEKELFVQTNGFPTLLWLEMMADDVRREEWLVAVTATQTSAVYFYTLR